MKVGVKYCGHCAPLAVMYGYYNQLQEQAPDLKFCFISQDQDVDVLLILNACPSECATNHNFTGPILVVSPNMVDHWPTSDDNMCTEMINRLRVMAQSS